MTAVAVAAGAISLVAAGLAGWAVTEARRCRMTAQSSARAAGRASLRADDAARGRRSDPWLSVPDPTARAVEPLDDEAPTVVLPELPPGPTLGELLDAEGLEMHSTIDRETGRQRVHVYPRQTPGGAT